MTFVLKVVLNLREKKKIREQVCQMRKGTRTNDMTYRALKPPPQPNKKKKIDGY